MQCVVDGGLMRAKQEPMSKVDCDVQQQKAAWPAEGHEHGKAPTVDLPWHSLGLFRVSRFEVSLGTL